MSLKVQPQNALITFPLAYGTDATLQEREESQNKEGMIAADLESMFYRYYSKLQPAIQAINQQREAIRDISTRYVSSSKEKSILEDVEISTLRW